MPHARRFASLRPGRDPGARAKAVRLAIVLAALGSVPACSARESWKLLREDGPHRTPTAEADYPSVYAAKPKDPPKTLNPGEQQALKTELQQAGATHKDATTAEITQP